MKKIRMILAVCGLCMGLSMTAQAEISKDTQRKICGVWYLRQEGYLFEVELKDPDSLQMNVTNLNTHHECEMDTPQHQRLYSLTLDPADAAHWICEDGRIDVHLYNGEKMWIRPTEEESAAFYNQQELFSLEKFPDNMANYLDYPDCRFMGNWVSPDTGKEYYIQPVNGHYGHGNQDYIIHTKELNEDGSMSFTDARVMTEHWFENILKVDVHPHPGYYMKLCDSEALEEYDDNDTLIDTFYLEEGTGCSAYTDESETEVSAAPVQEEPVTETPDTEETPASTALPMSSNLFFVNYMEGTYVGEDLAITLTLDPRYTEDPSYNDYIVDVVYFDPETGSVTAKDSFYLDNQENNWGYLYGLTENQEETGYNIIKIDDDTIQERFQKEVLRELKSIELVDNAYTRNNAQ